MDLLAISATIAYGLLAALGGIWGYVKSKSKPSLISGCVSGILLFIAAGIQIRGDSIGLAIAKVVVLLLVAVFTVRLIKTSKFMPSGIMLIAGIITLICLFS